MARSTKSLRSASREADYDSLLSEMGRCRSSDHRNAWDLDAQLEQAMEAHSARRQTPMSRSCPVVNAAE